MFYFVLFCFSPVVDFANEMTEKLKSFASMPNKNRLSIYLLVCLYLSMFYLTQYQNKKTKSKRLTVTGYQTRRTLEEWNDQ